MSDYNDPSGSYLAARYALGLATLEEIVSAEARIETDPAFAAEVARYDVVFSRLEPGLTPVTPPPSLWQRIEDAIDDLATSPQTQTVRASELAWEPFIPGIERKILFMDKAAGTSGVLYKLAPGAGVGSHGHSVIEECMVLEGEVEIDGVTVRAGDLHIALSSSRHGRLVSHTGCMVYIRGDLQMQA